jgi:hypothetical protein
MAKLMEGEAEKEKEEEKGGKSTNATTSRSSLSSATSITQCIVVPHCPYLLITHSTDGFVRLWDLNTQQFVVGVCTYAASTMCAVDAVSVVLVVCGRGGKGFGYMC